MQNFPFLLNMQHTYYYLFKNLSSSLDVKLSGSRANASLSIAISLTSRMVHIFELMNWYTECCKNNKEGH